MSKDEAWALLEYAFWDFYENDMSITYAEIKELLLEIKGVINV